MSRAWNRRTTIFSRLIAATLALASSCSTEDSPEQLTEDAPVEFRAGGPNPEGVAVEVGLLRVQPVVLAPTAPFGALPASARVDAQGSARYSIPIEVTPGPRGMQPQLTVAYSSSSDDGALGHRFDLAGYSSIARCTGNEADDGGYRPIRFDDTDALCVDGDRLVLASGVHAKAGAEYRTASEPFARIVLDDDAGEFGSAFTVHTRDGQVLKYGTVPASLWVGTTSGTQVPWRWSILRACDRWNNCVDYEYEHGTDLGNGPSELRPTAIRYGGTGAPASRRSVTFSWQARPDAETRFLFGATLRREERIERITVAGPNGGLVRSYRFDYQLHAQTGRTRLEAARLCDASDACLPPTTFEWSEDADATLTLAAATGDGLAEQQEALLRARSSLVGNFDGVGGDELLFRSDEADAPWLMWYGPQPDEDPVVGFPLLDDILPRPPIALGGEGLLAVPYYLDYLGRNTPEFSMSVIDFNGDVLDDVIIPVRGGWPSSSGGYDDDEIPYAQQFLVAANHDGNHFSTHYIDDGSEDPIYQMVPLDHDGDMFTDVWMCRGPSSTDSNWVLALHQGGSVPQFGFDFHETDIECSAFDELSVASVDGGPSSLLVIPAYADGTLIESDARDDYRRLRFDPDTMEAALEGTSLPRDRYQRTHDRLCRNAAAEASGFGPTSTAGLGYDRHIDLNHDGFADVLRFELASGDGVANSAIDDGMLTGQVTIGELLDGADWESISLCGDDDDLELDAVIAVYYNTGAGYVRGPDAIELSGNAHAQYWLNFVGAQAFDLEDDGRLDLLMPATGPDTGWIRLEAEPDGSMQVYDLEGVDGWPAYDNDATWRSQLETFSRVRVMAVGTSSDARPNLLFAGAIEDAEDLPYWINEYEVGDAEGKHRVETIVDGVGAVTTFEYEATYAPLMPSAEWPKAPLRGALWVTTEMAQSITHTFEEANEQFDEGAMRRRSYEYAGAAIDRRGRGFLGFERVSIDDHDGDQIRTQTIYDQTYDPTVDDYPARGRPVEREVYTTLGDFEYVERDLWSWSVHTLPQLGGVTHFVYPGTHREMHAELSAPLCEPDQWCANYDAPDVHRDVTTTETRDDFGTLLTSVRWATEGNGPITQIDQTEIVHDTDEWLVGQVGRVAVQTCSAGECAARITETQYDPTTGAVIASTLQPDDPALELVSVYGHDGHGNVDELSQTGADGSPAGTTRVRTTTWDAEGVFPLVHTNALGQASYVVHDPKSGVLVAEVDPAGLATKRSYDGLYRVVGEALHSSPLGGHDGAPTTFEYLGGDPAVEGSSLVVRATTTEGQRVTEYRSASGDLLERRWRGAAALPSGNPETIPAGVDVYERHAYDVRGRHVGISVPQWVGLQPVGWHRRTLDLLDRDTSKIAPDGVVLETIGYRSSGTDNITRVETRSTQAGATLVRSMHLDAAGLPVREIDADGVAACFTHGPFDVLTEVERNCLGAGPSPTSTTEYDAFGHPVSQSDPDLGTRVSTWNGFGELVEHVDGEDRSTVYVHDGLGRVTARIEPEGTASFVYDVERYGALDSDSSPDGITRTFDVDAFGRAWRTTTIVPTASGNDAYRFEWTYGPGGRVSQTTYPTPDNEPLVVTRNVYDQVGRLRIVKDHLTGSARWKMDTANPSDLPKTETYGDGTTSTRFYNPHRLWTEGIRHAKPGETLSDLSYVWSPEGELTSRGDAKFGESETFQYDKQWRVKAATVTHGGTPITRSFSYDVFGNLTSMTDVGTYQYDASVRLTAVGGTPITHDDSGNIETRGTATFSYNAFGKIKSMSQPGVTLSIRYDADGERVRRSQTDTQLNVVTLGKLYERRVSKAGTTTATTWRIPGGDRIVAQIVRTKNAVGAAYTTSEQYLHDDAQGSTVLVTATSGLGALVVARTSSDPWGRARAANNWNVWQTDAEASAVGIGFTGHRAELDQGLIDAGGRMYDPKMGRFMSADPVVVDAYAGAAYNRYSYVGNRPLRFTDPSGWAAEGGDDGPSLAEGSAQLEEFFGRLTNEFDARVSSAMSNAYYDVGTFIDDVEVGDVWTLYEVGVVGPALYAAQKGKEHLDGLVFAAQLITTNPEEAARLWGDEIVADAERVLTAHRAIGSALADGDYGRAAEIWWSAAKSAYSLASYVAGGAGTAKLGALAAKSAKAGAATTQATLTALENYASKMLKALKGSGVYVNTHASGKVYVGKGGWMRSQVSGRTMASRKGDPFVKTEWTWMKNSREAFKQESRVLDSYGGHKDPSNYNKIDSPGAKYRKQDGDP